MSEEQSFASSHRTAVKGTVAGLQLKEHFQVEF